MVGLGGSGLAAVDALLDRGLRVVGVDAGRVAAGAAGRNGGFLLAGAAAYLHTAIARWGADAAVGLYRATLAELDRLVQTLGPDVVRRVGSIRLAGLPGEPRDAAEEADRAAELADCTAHAAALRRYGFAVRDYAGPLGHGLFLPDDAAMNPPRRALRLAALLRDRAALHEQTRVRTVEAGRVVTEHGVVSAGVVIVAVDGGLDVLLPQLAGAVAHRPAADAGDRASSPRGCRARSMAGGDTTTPSRTRPGVCSSAAAAICSPLTSGRPTPHPPGPSRHGSSRWRPSSRVDRSR